MLGICIFRITAFIFKTLNLYSALGRGRLPPTVVGLGGGLKIKIFHPCFALPLPCFPPVSTLIRLTSFAFAMLRPGSFPKYASHACFPSRARAAASVIRGRRRISRTCSTGVPQNGAKLCYSLSKISRFFWYFDVVLLPWRIFTVAATPWMLSLSVVKKNSQWEDFLVKLWKSCVRWNALRSEELRNYGNIQKQHVKIEIKK